MADPVTSNPNLLALGASAIITGAVGFVLARLSKGNDARAAAEAALIGTGPDIIREQNVRINSQNERIRMLEDSYASLWRELSASMDRERDCNAKLAHMLGGQSELQARVRELESLMRGNRSDDAPDD